MVFIIHLTSSFIIPPHNFNFRTVLNVPVFSMFNNLFIEM
jgi:hypothetical protein